MYSEFFGHDMTAKLQRRILPHLVWNQEVFGQRVCDCLKPGVRWLDFGCGKRLLCGGLEKLESKLADYPFVGMDPCWENLQEQHQATWRVQADGHQLPFRNESFDLITANMVMEHVKYPNLVFQELDRVLAPGGTVLLHTPNLANYLVAGNRVLSKVIPHRLHTAIVRTSERRTEEEIYPTFYRANTRRKLCTLAGSGLKVVVEFLPGPRPFFHNFAPLALGELLMTRLSQLRPFQSFGTTLLVSMRKPAHVTPEWMGIQSKARRGTDSSHAYDFTESYTTAIVAARV
jgi:2-polyprenyl-3-methyl-5-hydroxy-6-metoxy-1,4-benzoquinol methylase